jgi:hypothetical protein
MKCRTPSLSGFIKIPTREKGREVCLPSTRDAVSNMLIPATDFISIDSQIPAKKEGREEDKFSRLFLQLGEEHVPIAKDAVNVQAGTAQLSSNSVDVLIQHDSYFRVKRSSINTISQFSIRDGFSRKQRDKESVLGFCEFNRSVFDNESTTLIIPTHIFGVQEQ